MRSNRRNDFVIVLRKFIGTISWLRSRGGHAIWGGAGLIEALPTLYLPGPRKLRAVGDVAGTISDFCVESVVKCKGALGRRRLPGGRGPSGRAASARSNRRRSASERDGILGCDRRQFSKSLKIGPSNWSRTAAVGRTAPVSCIVSPHAICARGEKYPQLRLAK